MTFCIEPMKTEHIGQIAQIERLCFSTPWPAQAFIDEMSNSLARYYVMLNGESVIAYGGFWHILNEAHITNIAVHPDYQNRGCGRRLLEYMISRARGMGIRYMTLEMRPSNEAARKLYQKCGFIQAGRRLRYYSDNNEDAIIMTKEW